MGPNEALILPNEACGSMKLVLLGDDLPYSWDSAAAWGKLS